MAPRAAVANVPFTVDSDTEDELNAFPTPDSNTENKAPTRKPRGKAAQMAKTAATTKATVKAKTTTRRASGNSVLGAKKQGAGVTKKTAARPSRKALAELPNANGSDTEEVDDFDADSENIAPAVEAKPARRGRPPKEKHVVEVAEEQLQKTRRGAANEPAPKKESKAKAVPKVKISKRAPVPEPEPEPEPEDMTVPETQPDPEPDEMDVEQSIEVEIPETVSRPQRPSARRVQPRVAPRQPSVSRRGASASDSERDPALRRKVGDLTKKLEAMTVKYDALKEAATSTKESNFDQLRKKSEQTAKDQDAVIKALKQQITELQSRSSEISALRKDMVRLEKENARLTTDNKKLNESLTAAQNDNKTLSNKLAAARSSAGPEHKNVPGSAIKSRVPGVVLPATVEAAKEALFQKQKAELYCDLTNMVVLNIKKNEEGDDVYDCLQSGRDGRTLHFNIVVIQDGESYEETRFIYIPLLDDERDRDLLALLPDFMIDELEFPRTQAPMLYSKMVDALFKKVEPEGDSTASD